jgi:tripartite-type tricarboxylate transporter receptor subunit TctC
MHPSSHIRALALALAICLPIPQAAAQDAVADFYRGKQLTIMVGFGPGGSASLYAQALAHHMGRHLPGNPGLIVQHAPGAGGLVVANTIYNTAPRDGSVFAITGRAFALEPLLSSQRVKFDPRRFGWLGTANVEYTTCLAWHTAPVKTLQDLMSQELIVGGSGTDTTEVIWPKAANKLVGTKIKFVTGYAGSSEINLAMERGEVQGNCGLGWMIVKLRKAEWLRDKKINILFQMAVDKHPDLADVPSIIDYARTPADRQVFELLFAPQEMGRPFFAPPGLPPERLRALRVAFEQTLKDPLFLAEAEKLGVEIQHRGGETIDALLEKIYSWPKDVIERAKHIAE